MAFNPKRIILHDYGKLPADQGAGMFNPYHTLVLPDGSVRYRYQGDPFVQEAPHAAAQNSEAIGLSYGGPVGSEPTPEALRSLQREYERIQGRFGNLPAAGHGEMWEAYKTHPFAVRRPSNDPHGRDVAEASWRNRVADLSQVPETGLPELSLLPKDPPASPFIAAAPPPPSKVAAAEPASDPKQESVPLPRPAAPMSQPEKPPEEKPSPFAASPKPAAQDTFGKAASDAHAQAAQAGQRTALEWASRRRPIKGLSTLNDQLFGA